MAKPKQKKTAKIDTSWHDRFLRLFACSLNAALAAEGAGVSRNTVYEHRKLFPEFAEQWAEAKAEAAERLQGRAYERAMSQSDLLIIFLLKAHMPEIYRERLDVAQTNLNVPWDDLNEDELKRIAAGEHPATVLASRSK